MTTHSGTFPSRTQDEFIKRSRIATLSSLTILNAGMTIMPSPPAKFVLNTTETSQTRSKVMAEYHLVNSLLLDRDHAKQPHEPLGAYLITPNPPSSTQARPLRTHPPSPPRPFNPHSQQPRTDTHPSHHSHHPRPDPRRPTRTLAHRRRRRRRTHASRARRRLRHAARTVPVIAMGFAR